MQTNDYIKQTALAGMENILFGKEAGIWSGLARMPLLKRLNPIARRGGYQNKVVSMFDKELLPGMLQKGVAPQDIALARKAMGNEAMKGYNLWQDVRGSAPVNIEDIIRSYMKSPVILANKLPGLPKKFVMLGGRSGSKARRVGSDVVNSEIRRTIPREADIIASRVAKETAMPSSSMLSKVWKNMKQHPGWWIGGGGLGLGGASLLGSSSINNTSNPIQNTYLNRNESSSYNPYWVNENKLESETY